MLKIIISNYCVPGKVSMSTVACCVEGSVVVVVVIILLVPFFDLSLLTLRTVSPFLVLNGPLNTEKLHHVGLRVLIGWASVSVTLLLPVGLVFHSSSGLGSATG